MMHEVYCKLNLGFKAKIMLVGDFLGSDFAHLSKWWDDQMRADENRM